MAWVKQKNPTSKNRTAHAPYNFVPLPETVVNVKGEELPEQNSYLEKQGEMSFHTGYLECTVLTESSLYIRCPLTPAEYDTQAIQIKEDEDKIPFREKLSNKPDFFYQKKKEEPVIPGSSLRGMLRTLLEIVSYSKIESVSKQKLYYRAVADPTLGRDYRQTISRVKAGYVVEKPDGGFTIVPAQSINGRTFFKVREEQLLSFPNFEPMYKNGKKNEDDYHPQYLRPIWFQPPTGRDRTGRPIETVRSVSDKKGNLPNQGVVVCSGYIEGKKKHTVVTAKSNNNPLEISEDLLRDYRDSLTDFQKDKLSKKNGCLIDKNPIFYLERNGNIEWLGHTPNFRIPYRQGNKTATPLDFIPQTLRQPEDLDLADAIFGYIGKSQNGKPASYASRVSVGDAYLEGGQDNPFYSDESIIPKILASPKPTTFQHYLVQNLPDETRTLKHYGSQPEKETVIRGHKLYWHKGEVLVEDVEETKENKEDKQHTMMKPLRAGLKFKFRIYFENLSDIELGALLWVLKLPGEEPDSYRHKIGMGKPYGLGSIKINSALKLEDRQSRSDRSGRYDTLFDENGKWATGWISEPENNDITANSIHAFERFILESVVGKNNKIQNLAELERIQMLLRLLEYPGPENSDQTEYMRIEHPDPISPSGKRNEYKNRPVLPTPLPILHKRGITRVRVKNYKSLADVNVRLGKLTILVGENGAGKSNFVDSLKFVAEGIENLREAIDLRGGIKMLRRWSNADSNEPLPSIHISINVEDDGLQGEYHLEISSHNESYKVQREHCFIEAEGQVGEYEISNGDLLGGSSILNKALLNDTELHLRIVSRVSPFDRLYTILNKLAFYEINPSDLRMPQEAKDKRALNVKGTNLAGILKVMLESKSDRLNEIKWALRKAVSDIEDIQVEEVGGYFIIKFKHNWHTELLDAKQESDGTLRLLALLTALYQDQPSWSIGIEEPETAIHPGALGVLYGELKLISQSRSQVILITHSPDLIASASISELRAVEKNRGTTYIGEIDESQRELVYQRLFTPGDLMRMGNFQRDN